MIARTALSDPLGLANEILAQLPGRRTRGRTAVLATLIERQAALTHTEIERCLPPDVTLDRVTLYRILDWLTEQRVVHRVSGADRAVRYAFSRRWNTEPAPVLHGHYQCRKCGRVGCLEEVRANHLPLPEGLRLQHVDLLVHVDCELPGCEHARANK